MDGLLVVSFIEKNITYKHMQTKVANAVTQTPFWAVTSWLDELEKLDGVLKFVAVLICL